MKKAILAVIFDTFLLFSLGCFPPDFPSPTQEEIRKPAWLTDEEIISLVRKGIVNWAEAREMFMRKGYTWWEAEMKLKAHILEKDWIS